MGSGKFDSRAWAETRTDYTPDAKPTVDHIYKGRSLDSGLDPVGIKLRESRDSDANPNSTAVIIGLDVTGSMTKVLDAMARHGLGTLVGSIYERQPITDPHIMVMGIGDFEYDVAPLQVTQFEAENRPMVEQLEKIYLERGGGGNHYESYAAAWLFAAMRTSLDCFEKRGRKGLIFTVGDEEPTPVLHAHAIKRFLGLDVQDDVEGAKLLAMAQAAYEVFHVIVEEGDYYTRKPEQTRRAWTELLGQRALLLADHTKLAELVVSVMQVMNGADRDSVVNSWSASTNAVVARGLSALSVTRPTPDSSMKLGY